MNTGLVVRPKQPASATSGAVCLGDAGDGRSWFIDTAGNIFVVTWDEFLARYWVVGLFEALSTYRFTSPERARADFAAGVFLDGLALAAAARVPVLTPGRPKPY